MDKRELYFNVVRTNSEIITLFFNNWGETKLAFRAIIDLLGTNPGIVLQARPIHAITLNRVSGGWLAWRRSVMPYITEVNPEGGHCMVLCDGKLTNNHLTFPLCVRADTIFPVEEIPWD